MIEVSFNSLALLAQQISIGSVVDDEVEKLTEERRARDIFVRVLNRDYLGRPEKTLLPIIFQLIARFPRILIKSVLIRASRKELGPKEAADIKKATAIFKENQKQIGREFFKNSEDKLFLAACESLDKLQLEKKILKNWRKACLKCIESFLSLDSWTSYQRIHSVVALGLDRLAKKELEKLNLQETTDDEQWALIYEAASRGCAQTIGRLLCKQRFKSREAYQENLMNLLLHAIEGSSLEQHNFQMGVMEFPLQQFDLNFQTALSKETLLHKILKSESIFTLERVKVVKRLLQKPGLNLNLQDANGMSAFEIAVLSHRKTIGELFLRDCASKPPLVALNRVDLNLQDEVGNTILHKILMLQEVYSERKYGVIKQLLRDSRLNLNLQNAEGMSSFDFAVLSYEKRIAQLLLCEPDRIDPNLQDKDGNTILHKIAADLRPKFFQSVRCEPWNQQKWETELVEMLFMHPKIDPTLQNFQGRTPFKEAMSNHKGYIVELLKRRWQDQSEVSFRGEEIPR